MFLILEAMRPRQWLKNFIIFAGLLFSKRFLDPSSVAVVCTVFAIFCALSGAVYLLNDVVDRDADRRHELKRLRPVASGRLGTGRAMAVSASLAGFSIAAAFYINAGVGVTALLYLSLITAYTLFLKHVVIVDVIVISLGFVLRAFVGGVAIGVEVSPWLLVCTILLALFLALSKRRHELTLLEEEAGDHRPILDEYSVHLLDQMIAVVTSSTLMAYILYTLWPRTQHEVSDKLYFTIPFVLYGIFRYLWLVHQGEGGGSPERDLLSDRPLMIDAFLWAACCAVILWIG